MYNYFSTTTTKYYKIILLLSTSSSSSSSSINRSTKLISIQHKKKHGKGSKNSSAYFDSRIDIEQETDRR